MSRRTERELRDIHVGPVHPGRGEPSYIELRAIPAWLKDGWYVSARLSPTEAVKLIEQLAIAVRVTTP